MALNKANETDMRLTVLELEVTSHLEQAWNLFLQLEVLHPDETAEFRSKIHDMQRMVYARPLLRSRRFYIAQGERGRHRNGSGDLNGRVIGD